jgi:Flp pilus assembly protein TadG
MYMKKKLPQKAQAMVEFALALPIFLMVVYGLLETGRLVYLYSAVTTASREAARYGSAWGINNSADEIPKYQDCVGIRNAARQVGILLDLQDEDILIQYDHGPDDTTVITVCDATTGADGEVASAVVTGDRVVVTVQYSYDPIINVIPSWSNRIISSGPSARTIVGRINLNGP